MLASFSVLPPEINSARLFGGAGSAPMLAAATAWDGLSAELSGAAGSFGSVTSGLAAGVWQGPASAAMTVAAGHYVGWLRTSALHAAGAAAAARAAAAEFEAALAATVHPVAVAANRAQLASLVMTNLFGQNAPAIAAAESWYEQMWAQDVSAMAGYYGGAAAVAAQLAPWSQQLGTIGGAVGGSAGAGLPRASGLSATGANTRSIGTNVAAAQTIAEVMGGSGIPMPSRRYVQLANSLYIGRSVGGAVAQALFTPEGLYPVTGVKNLTFDTSVARGVVILESAIREQITAGNNVTVFGYSQSATISSLTMTKLAASINPPTPDQLSFTLVGDPNNPNGGVATRFPGLSLPSLGITASGATPDNLYPTRIYTLEYDGVADFPRYPLNLVSTLNALAGAYYVHTDYLFLTPAQIDAAVHLTNTVGPTMTDYYMIRTEDLPLLEPLRALPVLGDPLADLVQPNLEVIVNLGYGDPAYGYSTSPPNVATPFGLWPEVSPLTIADALAAGTQQGIHDFGYDISHLDLPQITNGSSSPVGNPQAAPTTGPAAPMVSINTIIDDLQAANSQVANTITEVGAASYAALLPTADIANAAITSVPSYNINLFLDGIQQVANGDPMGFVTAVGYPLAADVALITVAGLLQAFVLVNAGQAIAHAITTPIG
ncbi:PPE family protein [Mycobacterium marinum]|uniref:PPE family protein n=1 Tax=Mycobacterium marinum TaxID=1781 RepID=UPI000564ACEB|nr:PPE family protein [Mycobacterium marinum]